MKRVKILTILLVIVLITMVGIFGVYTKVQNRMENKVKDYTLSADLNGTRNIRMKVISETETVIKDAEGNIIVDAEDMTDDELNEKGYVKEEVEKQNYTEDDYKTIKEIIEKRLKGYNVASYEISMDSSTGEILIQVPEEDTADTVAGNIATTGKFEIVDSETEEVLLDNSQIKEAKVMYGSNSSTGAVSVYLEIDFTKEGSKILKEISTTYAEKDDEEDSDNSVELTEETDEENEEAVDESTEEITEGTTEEIEEETEESTEETEKQITMKIDDDEIVTTAFEEPITTGKIQLSIGSSTTNEETLNGYISQATIVATTLDSGNLPVEYEITENDYIKSDITENHLQVIAIIVFALILIEILYLTIKYRVNGLLAGLTLIGFTALHLLIIRYANVQISLLGILGIILISIVNFIFIRLLLENTLNKDNISLVITKTFKEFFIKIIPMCIIAIVFTFSDWAIISSMGMVMVWGIALMAAYDFVITCTILKTRAEKK